MSTVCPINKEYVYHSLKPYQETYDTDLLLCSQAMEAPPTFLTLPTELMVEILRRLPDFTALLKVTQSYTHIRKLFERSIDTIVWAIFENLWLQIT
jgi:hypothetical protein